MNAFSPRALVLAAAMALLPVAAAAQARDSMNTVQIRIHAQQGGQPLAGANVELMGMARAQNADSTGVVRFANVPPGPLLVQIRKFGYGDERVTLMLGTGDTVTVDADMQTRAVRLAEVRATARYSSSLRQSGFLERRSTGLGSYAMRTEWAQRGRLLLTDVVRRMRGVRVVRTADGRSVLVPSRKLASVTGTCPTVQVYVDGVQVAFDPAHDDINNLVSISQVEAVEAYAGGAETPAQFNGTGSSCGVVLIWLRKEA